MDPDSEVERIFDLGNGEEKEKWERPPSSYGSMKSDPDPDEEVLVEEIVAELPVIPVHELTGFQLIRSESPETIYTQTTQQTKPLGAFIIDTRSFGELEDLEEVDEEDYLDRDSPEPPSPVEPEEEEQEEQTEETDESQPGRKHPEQEMPHIFKTLLVVLSKLSSSELRSFKLWFFSNRREPEGDIEGDVLDLVDKMIERTDMDEALCSGISNLQQIHKNEEADELERKCKRALVRYHLKQWLIRKHQVIFEGIPEGGKQNLLKDVYVHPELSIAGKGAIDPYHELRPQPIWHLPLPTPDTFVDINNQFRMRKDNGEYIRTLVTTGLPRSGNTVCVYKFCLDWAEERANKDIQFVIQLPMNSVWSVRNLHLPESKTISLMGLIEYHHNECKGMPFLEEPDCKYVLVLDSFDVYQADWDWNTPAITDVHTEAYPDALIVNLIRGNLLPHARVWVLGRRGAVSQIPAQYIDKLIENQGFTEAMKDDHLTKRFSKPNLIAHVNPHSKKVPSLRGFIRHPFFCWMVATVFERCFRYEGYGVDPPKLTPFYVHVMVVQSHRRLSRYCGVRENDVRYGDEERILHTKLGKMALKMLEKNVAMFSEKDLEEHGLKLKDTVIHGGLCTEIPTTTPTAKKYAFIHFTFQEFMAAMYTFLSLCMDGKNVLGPLPNLQLPKLFHAKDQTKSAVGLVHSALARTLGSPLGHYDMFLRFLCGMLCKDNHVSLLRGMARSPTVMGVDEAEKLLSKAIDTAPAERQENLKECLRELRIEK